MSNAKDFVIKKGILVEYNGPKGGEIVIPEGVESCSLGVWDSCESFTLTIPSTMSLTFKEIYYENIVGVNISAGTTIQEPEGIFSCGLVPNLKNINVDPANTEFSSKDNVLYDKKMKVLYSCPTAAKEVIIPSTVVEIKDHAFADCRKLKRLVVPESVQIIGEHAFNGYTSIYSAGFKTDDKQKFNYEFQWTKEIPDNAFRNLKKLKKVTLPSTIEKMHLNLVANWKK